MIDRFLRTLIATVFVWACAGSASPSPDTPPPSAVPAPSTTPAASAPKSEPSASSAPEPEVGEEKQPLSSAPAGSPDVAKAHSSGGSGGTTGPPSRTPPAGGADDAALRRVAERAQECYAYSVGRDLPPGASGTLRVDIGIGPSGNVVDAAVRPSASTKELMGGRFEQCLVDAVRRERFASSRGGEERWLLAPFEFSPPP